MQNRIRFIAFYLPQYHPIPENDEWWGKGFTEWTNVAKAKPLFRGHYQPHLPADLGFYDLRVPEVREQQAELAREAGIEGFCYWHYWFAGKQLLERPFNEVLASGKPDFPFCIGWANESWTGVWHGAPNKILIEQTYPGEEDHRAHFESLLPAFQDERYIQVDGKPMLVIFRPRQFPDTQRTITLWKEMALKAGLPGIFFIAIAGNVESGEHFSSLGFDAVTIIPSGYIPPEDHNLFLQFLIRMFGKDKFIKTYHKLLRKPYRINDYEENTKSSVIEDETSFEYFPAIGPGWDNTPRVGIDGYVVVNNTPEKFKSLCRRALRRVSQYSDGHKIIFVKSWNEWAEGNYLEPDQRFGHGFLLALRDAIDQKEESGS